MSIVSTIFRNMSKKSPIFDISTFRVDPIDRFPEYVDLRPENRQVRSIGRSHRHQCDPVIGFGDASAGAD